MSKRMSDLYPVGARVRVAVTENLPNSLWGFEGSVTQHYNSGSVEVTLDDCSRNPLTIGLLDSLELIEAAPEPTGSRGDALANGERMQEYGSPTPSFTRIGRLWSAYLSAPEVDPDNLTADDVSSMMMLLKVSRRITDKKADTLDDIEGYVSCSRMIQAEQAA